MSPLMVDKQKYGFCQRTFDLGVSTYGFLGLSDHMSIFVIDMYKIAVLKQLSSL